MSTPIDMPAVKTPPNYAPLRRLGIEPAHLASLAVQGFLSSEDRGGKRPIVKLRYRFGGRQLVKYVGSDASVVAAVRDDLHRLQQAYRRERELRRLALCARILLRQAKRRLEPLLATRGWTFHGYAIRRSEVS